MYFSSFSGDSMSKIISILVIKLLAFEDELSVHIKMNYLFGSFYIANIDVILEIHQSPSPNDTSSLGNCVIFSVWERNTIVTRGVFLWFLIHFQLSIV